MRKSLIALSLAAFIYAPLASAYDCIGKVNNVVAGPNGVLTVSFGTINWVYLCSVNEPYNGVTPEACKSILSVLMAAKLSERNVQFWFHDSSNDCTGTQHTPWGELKNWYFGPALL